ncbi:MAG: restriction endonuclease subunit S [Oscillibacter sp.]|nr:restriction endonuclease subunit S [Oscillibacter sp.]
MKPEIKNRIDQIRRGQVPEGYVRDRKVLLPVGWEYCPIKDVAIVSSGSTPARNNPKYWNGNIPWVTTGELESGHVVSTIESVSKQAVENLNLTVYPKGTLLMAMYGQGKTRGTVAMLEIDATVNQACAAITLKQGKPKFLFFQLQNAYENIRKLSNTGNQENLNADIVKTFRILWAPDAEQQKIAAILTAQDKIIELKGKLIAEKQRHKKYLMQLLLTGKKRLRGESGTWKTEQLGKLFLNRVETKREDLQLLAITGTQGIIPRSELDLKDNSSEDKSKYLRICVGDIGYNTMRMWQGVSAYSNYEGIVSPAYTILSPTDAVNAKYFAYLFKMPEVIFLFYRFSQGLVDDTRNLKCENFKRIKATYPESISEQNAIVRILEAADQEISLLQQSLEQEKQKKKALMQLLLTGIVRVRV